MKTAVCVASFRTPDLLSACLESIVPQARRAGAAVIVARPPGELVPRLATQFRDVRFVSGAATDIPRLRGAALASAAADFVAMTEDHCIADPVWLETLAKTQQETGADVVGGGMGNARGDRAVDWAAYFAEYGFFSWARPRDTVDRPPLLTGANVGYVKSLHGDLVTWMLNGTWENVCHDRLFAARRRFAFAPNARVLQNHTYQFRAFCRDRYEHGRDYARVRTAQAGTAERWRLLAMTPLLPPVLTARVARAAAGVAPAAFVRALPVTVAFLTAWTWGEAVGYGTGAPYRAPFGSDIAG